MSLSGWYTVLLVFSVVVFVCDSVICFGGSLFPDIEPYDDCLFVVLFVVFLTVDAL